MVDNLLKERGKSDAGRIEETRILLNQEDNPSLQKLVVLLIIKTFGGGRLKVFSRRYKGNLYLFMFFWREDY